MSVIKSELEKRLKRKRAEISALEGEIEHFEDRIAGSREKISTLEATLQELQSLYNLIPSEADVSGPQPAFRQNSEGWLVHEVLRNAGKPMYVDEILEQLGREITIEARGSLAGQLGGYVRKGQVFTRPAPNTFGLREWEVNGYREESSHIPPLKLPDESQPGEALKLEPGDIEDDNNNEVESAA
jgi:hypothetical protein